MAAHWKSLLLCITRSTCCSTEATQTEGPPLMWRSKWCLCFCFFLGGRKNPKLCVYACFPTSPSPPTVILHFSEKVLRYFSICSFQPVPTSPTSTSPTPGGTLGMSKMDAPSMQDVYILSPVSGLYGTRSDRRSWWLSWSHTWRWWCCSPPERTWVSCHVTTSVATA